MNTDIQTATAGNLSHLVDIYEAIEYFIKQDDCKESSKRLYRKTLRLFFEWVEKENKDIATLSKVDIVEYKEHLQGRGLSSLSVSSYLTSLRKFYEWAESERLSPNIVKGVKTPRRVQQFKKQHLTEKKSKELLQYFESVSKRDFAIINLLLRTGLRTIEVVRADVGDITFKNGRRILKVWGKGKDNKDDFVILTDKAFQPIAEYLKTRGQVKENEPLFTSTSHRNNGERLTTRTISGICKQGLRAIGLDAREFTAHSLRHTTATMILKHGGQLTDAQNVLRHASPNTTQIYIESIKEDLRIRRAPEQRLDAIF